MTLRPPITRRQFLSTVGAAALSLLLIRLGTMQSTWSALLPDAASDAYGQSAYGA